MLDKNLEKEKRRKKRKNWEGYHQRITKSRADKEKSMKSKHKMRDIGYVEEDEEYY